MNIQEILAEVEKLGAKLVVKDGRLKTAPRGVLPIDLKAAIRERVPEIKAALIALPLPVTSEIADTKASAIDSAAEALTILARLKGYVLPGGRMSIARSIALSLRPLLTAPVLDTVQALAALQSMEAEVIALGGIYEPELACSIELMARIFPGAQLVSDVPFCDQRLDIFPIDRRKLH